MQSMRGLFYKSHHINDFEKFEDCLSRFLLSGLYYLIHLSNIIDFNARRLFRRRLWIGARSHLLQIRRRVTLLLFRFLYQKLIFLDPNKTYQIPIFRVLDLLKYARLESEAIKKIINNSCKSGIGTAFLMQDKKP